MEVEILRFILVFNDLGFISSVLGNNRRVETAVGNAVTVGKIPNAHCLSSV